MPPASPPVRSGAGPPRAGAWGPGASLLAVGDTGTRSGDDDAGALLAVGRAMACEHARRPASALVLLGDNFYPFGLHEQGLARRIRENVAQPFQAFAALGGPRSAELGELRTARDPVPILAVLGNHDVIAPDSARLQRSAVAGFLPGWRMPADLVETVELGGGLSVVLVDSNRLAGRPSDDGGFRQVADALAATRGPFRVLALHHPVTETRPGSGDSARQHVGALHRILESEDAAVHVVLSGHEHNIQALRPRIAGGPLHVLAGGGSSTRPMRSRARDRLFGVVDLGFARVDVVGAGTDARLDVGLFAVRGRGRPPVRIARFAVDADRRVRRLHAEGRLRRAWRRLAARGAAGAAG